MNHSDQILKKITSFLPIIFLTLYIFSFTYRSDQSFDQDLGRHLKLGAIISSSLQVPKTNLFSYTNTNFPFVNSHYLFEVFVYQVQQLVGLQLLLFLKIILITFSALTFFIFTDYKRSSLILPLSFIFFHVYRERVELRPELFSFLFTSLTLLILHKFSKSISKLIFILPFLQLIWINTHIYFIVGLILQSIFCLTFLIKRDSKRIKYSLITLGASIIFSLLNPNGLSGLFFPLTVQGNYGYTIVENLSFLSLEKLGFYENNFLFLKLCSALILFGIIRAFTQKRLSLINLLLPVFGLVLGLINTRGTPYLALIALPSTVVNFGTFKNLKFLRIMNLITIFLIIYESSLYLSGEYYKLIDSSYSVELKFEQNAKPAIDFFLSQNLPGPIYNNFDIGGYLIYRIYPKYQVFVDNRPEAYPANFFQDNYIPSQMSTELFSKLEDKYQFKSIIFSINDQTQWGKAFLSQIVGNINWKTVYLDDSIIILVRSDVAGQIIKTLDIASVRPEDYTYSNHVSYLHLALFFMNIGLHNQSEKFAQHALDIFPNSPTSNSLMSYFQSQNSSFNNLVVQNEYSKKTSRRIWW